MSFDGLPKHAVVKHSLWMTQMENLIEAVAKKSAVMDK